MRIFQGGKREAEGRDGVIVLKQPYMRYVAFDVAIDSRF